MGDRPIPHGTPSGYSYHGCRCDLCVAEKRARDRAYYERTSTRPKRTLLTDEERAERNRQRVRDWKQANPEKAKALGVAYRERNRDAIRARSRAYFQRIWQANPDAYRAYKRAYSRTDQGRIISRAARHKRRGVPLSPEARSWWRNLRVKTCWYCSGEATEIDHIVPISRGGTGELVNVVPACRSCNASKNALTGAEFLSRKDVA